MNNASKFNIGFLIIIVAMVGVRTYIQWKRSAVDVTIDVQENNQKKFGYLCCFCKNDLSSNITAMVVVTNWDKNEEFQHEQLLFCHKECLNESVADDLFVIAD
ncbi:MAG TPA: hypothetical protein VFF04_04415 [Candidatus Babeliales bacterium]|nr:hypothetical protein [Candidatus Babeliales bacterium]